MQKLGAVFTLLKYGKQNEIALAIPCNLHKKSMLWFAFTIVRKL